MKKANLFTFSLRVEKNRNFYKNQAAILRSCRALSKLLQKEVASRVGVSAATVCSWEANGCRDLQYCSLLADIYGQDLSILVPSTYKPTS